MKGYLTLVEVNGCPEIVITGGKWSRPEHIRYVRRRKHSYLVCVCGKERRAIAYYLTKKDAKAQRNERFGVMSMSWCRDHEACAPAEECPF